MDPAQQAELLTWPCATLGVERPVVAGHSWARSWPSPSLNATRPMLRV